MVFNSYTFFIFLACVLALHYVPFSWRIKKFNLLWASYLFYAAWNPPFVLLLWLSTIVDWFAAKRMDVASSTFRRRTWLCVSLTANLGVLGFFKYGDFVLDNFVTMLASLGVDYDPARPDIILPVGISFYTFQTLSYTLDVYFKRGRPWNSFLDFALYVTFFPQLVAGPIVRAADFHPQCESPRRATAQQFLWGLVLLVVGLFEKIVVADGLMAPVAENVYDSAKTPDFVSAWCGTLAFSGQIFCDFAGYSICAIGVAMCLGFRIPDNFRSPYAACGFSDFWRRWHISLSTWLRDYLYIPLGGNRKGNLRTYVNLMVTMLIGGLWHGASWTFVAWGGLHGMYLAIERAFRARYPASAKPHGRIRELIAVAATFLLVCFTWVFFRARTFEAAFSTLAAMVGLAAHSAERVIGRQALGVSLVTMLAILLVHWVLRERTLEEVANRLPWWVVSLTIAVMLFLIVTMPGEDRAFIYFQF